MNTLEEAFTNTDNVIRLIKENNTVKDVISALKIKDGKPARRMFNQFVEENNCCLEHFRNRPPVKNPDALDIEQTLEKFKNKKQLSNLEEKQLRNYVSLLTLFLCCGRVAKHSHAHRLYISLPERRNEEIEQTRYLLKQVFPDKKIGFSTNSSTKNNHKKWCELSVYDKAIGSIYGGISKGRKTKISKISLEEWKVHLINTYSLDALKGFFLFSGKTSEQSQIYYQFDHVNLFILKLFEKLCQKNNFIVEKEDYVIKLKDTTQVAIIHLLVKQELIPCQIIEILLNKNITDEMKRKIEKTLLKLSEKTSISSIAESNKKYVPKPVLDTDEKKSAYSKLLGLYLGDGHIDQSKHRKNIYRLRIFLDNAYPQVIDETIRCCEIVFPSNKVGCLNKANQIGKGKANCSEVMVHSQYLVNFFPQHGAGKKHNRDIILQNWQQDIVYKYPLEFFQGLHLSDGCTCMVKSIGEIRYQFTNISEDIKQLFRETCDRLYIPYSNNGTNKKNIAIQRKRAVAFLHRHVGFKYDLRLSSSQEYFDDVRKTFNIVGNNFPEGFSINQKIVEPADKNNESKTIDLSKFCSCGVRKYKDFDVCKPCGVKQDLISSKVCVICKEKFYSQDPIAKFCSQECSHKNQRRVKHPSKEELEKMVWEKPVTVIAEEYGVSDNAVRKWCKKYNIDRPRVGYWAKRKAEEENNILPVTEDELVRLVDSGMSIEGLATHFRVAVGKVNHWLALHSLRTKGQIKLGVYPKLKEL